MPLTHRGSFSADREAYEAVGSDEAYNRAKNRKEDLDRQLKVDQVRDHVTHPGKVARKASS
jgi:hypothetical protein